MPVEEAAGQAVLLGAQLRIHSGACGGHGEHLVIDARQLQPAGTSKRQVQLFMPPAADGVPGTAAARMYVLSNELMLTTLRPCIESSMGEKLLATDWARCGRQAEGLLAICGCSCAVLCCVVLCCAVLCCAVLEDSAARRT